MAFTKLALNDYVDSLIGVSAIPISNNQMLAGMEDIVNKLQILMPERLGDLVVESEITSTPQTVPTASTYIKITADDQVAVRVDGVEHVGNPYSLKYDGGSTTYYYIVGDKVHIYPFETTPPPKYKMQSLSYGVNGGTVVWPSAMLYPLALFCAADRQLVSFNKELAAVTSEISNLPTLPTLTGEYLNVDTRLSSDDAEMAAARINKIRTYIEANASLLGSKATTFQVLVQNASMLFSSYMTLRGRYAEWFGLTQVQKGKTE